MDDYIETKLYVVCKKNLEFISVEHIKITDVEEDYQGNDKVTFLCPYCNVNHRSKVVSRGETN